MRRVGELEFRQIGGYWIDSRCREFSGAEIVEMRAGSEGAAPILQEISGLDALLEDKEPVLVHWRGRNYLIR